QEDSVAPDDGGGVAGAGQFRLPEEVLGLAPAQGDVAVVGVSLAGGSAPLGPGRELTPRGGGFLRRQQAGGEGQGQGEQKGGPAGGKGGASGVGGTIQRYPTRPGPALPHAGWICPPVLWWGGVETYPRDTLPPERGARHAGRHGFSRHAAAD